MKPFRKIISFLIVALFFMSFLPAVSLPVAAAADGDPVLLTMGHKDTNTVDVEDANNVTLLVPFSYPAATLNLSDGLSFTYDSMYDEVVASVPAVSVIDSSSPVTVTVTFIRQDDNADDPRWTTEYNVYVERAPVVDPTFTGTLTKDIKANGSLDFTSIDFLQFYTKNDGAAITAISITGVNNPYGTLKLGAANYPYKARIPFTSPDPNIATVAQLSFSSGDVSDVLPVYYEVYAYAGDATPIGQVILTITTYPEPKINTAFTGTVNKGAELTFTQADFTSHCNLFGLPLESLQITPSNTASGKWYLGPTALSTTTTTPIDAADIGSLYFSGIAPGNATFSWSATTMAGTSAEGTGTITVESPKLTLIPYYSNTSVIKGNTWTVNTTHFVYSQAVPLTYIKITALPVAADGSLILTTALPKNDTYGYTAIAANAVVPINAVIPAAYINYLRLTTKSTSTKSQVSFVWTATSDTKVTGATWGDPAEYNVSFMTASTVYYATEMNIPVTFSANDFVAAFPAAAGSALSYVTFTLPDKALGSLFLNYNVGTKMGTAVTATIKYYTGKTPNLSNITFVPGKDFTGSVSISYTAYMDNGKFITGTISVYINFNSGGTVSYVSDKNSALQLDAKDFQSAFFSATGKSLSRVKFTLPSASYGKLVYNYTLSGDYDKDVSSTDYYYFNEPQYLSLVTFIPTQNFTGSVAINFTGNIENSTYSYSGKLIIFVVDSPGGIVTYPVRENGVAIISGADFSQEFIRVTGSVLSYVTFTPPTATNGSLYTQYNADTNTGTKVASATKFYDGKSPDISDITYLPPKDFTGTIVLLYKAYTTSGVSYEGKLKFTVYEGSSVISYITDSTKPLQMNSNNFFNAFYMNSDGRSLSYITLEAPSSSYGKFYYNYTSPAKFDYLVTNDKKLYVSGSPYISKVMFVPQENYAGTFYVNYTGYTSTGTSFTGKIKITVRSVNNGSVTYETNSATPVTLKSSDFIAALTGKSAYALSYVKFALPYESYGTLYYGYSSQISNNARISPATSYSVTILSNITFVPNRDFSGVLAISYTAFDTSLNAFSGTILITVKSTDIGTITYTTNMNKPVVFNADDFNTAFLTKSGSLLDHVTFTLPSSSVGTLYLGYLSPSSYTSKVTASTNYYRLYSPQLSNITFVPYSGYTGTVTLQYTAYSTTGSPYYGKIVINQTSVPFSDMGAHEWAKEAVSFLYRNGVISDNANEKYYPGVDMTRADFIVMIVNAFNITGGWDNFPDVPATSEYYDAISAAKALDIVRGSSDGNFYPQSGLTRQDGMVIIVRALEAVGLPLSGDASVLAGFPDKSAVSDYAVESVAALVRTGFVQGNAAGYLIPKSMLSRAETAVILYRILTM